MFALVLHWEGLDSSSPFLRQHADRGHCPGAGRYVQSLKRERGREKLEEQNGGGPRKQGNVKI